MLQCFAHGFLPDPHGGVLCALPHCHVPASPCFHFEHRGDDLLDRSSPPLRPPVATGVSILAPCSQGNTCSQEKQWDILEILHHLEARQEVNAMLREQACLH